MRTGGVSVEGRGGGGDVHAQSLDSLPENEARQRRKNKLNLRNNC
jgi:hypothetical protein